MAKATLKPRRKKWYARVRWSDQKGKRKEKQIPLKTSSKVTARLRLSEVNKVRKDIADGLQFIFPWMTDLGEETKLKRLTVFQAFDEYQIHRKNDGVKDSTLERTKTSIKNLVEVVGKSYAISDICKGHIDAFKARWNNIHIARTMNTDLNRINTFLKWCHSQNYIEDIPVIKKVREPKKPISYISDKVFKEIMNMLDIDPFLKRIWIFYRETGLRRAEPWLATLEGDWLIVPPESKGGHERVVELNSTLKDIFNEMQMSWQKTKSKPRSIQDFYSKKFKKACREVGIDRHLHNLRDTYAIRMWAVTGDIYLVSKLIGHTYVSTTQKYANFDLRRLMDDFPSIKKQIKNRIKTPRIAFGDTRMWDTNHASA